MKSGKARRKRYTKQSLQIQTLSNSDTEDPPCKDIRLCPARLQPLARSKDQPVQRRPDGLELYFLCQRADRAEENRRVRLPEGSRQHFSAAVAPPSGSGLPELLQSAEKRISKIQIQKKQKKQLFDRMRQSEHPPVRRLFETAEDRTGQDEAA